MNDVARGNQPQGTSPRDFFGDIIARVRAHFTTFEITPALLLLGDWI